MPDVLGYDFYDCQQAIDEINRSINFFEFTEGQPINPNSPALVSNRGTAKPTVSRSGVVRGYDVTTAGSSPTVPESSVNSNIGGGSYGANSKNFAINVGDYETSGGKVKPFSGAKKVGTTTRVATVASKLNVAATAGAAGCFLGAKIDSALYNIGKFFDLNPPESLNPETWDSLASTEFGKSVIRHLFDLEGDGGTMYMPEDVIEYMYKFWDSLGAWTTGTYSVTPGQNAGKGVETGTILYETGYIDNSPFGPDTYKYSPPISIHSTDPLKTTFIRSTDLADQIIELSITTLADRIIIASSQKITSGRVVYMTPDGHYAGGTSSAQSSYTYNGQTVWFYRIANEMPLYQTSSPSVNNDQSIAWLSRYGNAVGGSGVTGFEPDPDAEQPGTIDPTQPILPQLKQNMPNTFSNPIQETVPQPDGTNKTITYYPVPWPKDGTTDSPTTGDNKQGNPKVTPENTTETQIKDLIDLITETIAPSPDIPNKPTTPTPPDTGSGSSPTVVAPTGNASSLWAVYNPTQAQLDAFGSWLWSSNFVEQIKKLFNDPMQAIVGVHKVFATPSTDGQVNIKCGYIDSGCPAARVSNQYTTINCGTVSVREYYGNVLDYSPFTEISLYLPFIGIVKLDVADVMRGSVQVKYHVDVITGACLADVIVHRDGEDSVLYQYSGSAIVTYPISSGSYASMAAGVLSLAAGVAGTIATGGAAAPALIGGAVGLSHLHTDVQKSGSFSGSPGAMGCKKPYLIISRAQEAVPNDFEKYEGKPASKTVRVGDCDGFIKVKSINIDNVPATYGELDQIVALLKTGVIL